MPEPPDEEVLERRKQWFEWYMNKLDNESVLAGPQENGELYACPCCHQKTLTERGGYEICSECDWEDDGQDDADADTVRGGPNGSISLTEARKIYLETRGSAHVNRVNTRQIRPE